MINALEYNPSELEIIELESLDYERCLEIQKSMVRDRASDNAPDRLLLVSHPPVVTIGKSGSYNDLHLSKEALSDKGIQVCRTDRGGKSTFHDTDQLVAYPILKLKNKDLHSYVQSLLNVTASVLIDRNLKTEFRPGIPGVWVNNGKIASIGISMKNWVVYHGVALNVNTDVSNFDLINPCGIRGQRITSMKNELGEQQDLIQIKKCFVDHFLRTFGYSKIKTNRHPPWLTIPTRSPIEINKVADLIRHLNLETVCQSAKCPNLGECFSKGTATFLILGRYCTRNCGFCAVEKGIPAPPDNEEPYRVAIAVKKMALNCAVITSVTRDDLQDGGADQFVRTMRSIRDVCPDTLVEVLVPDFNGNKQAIESVCKAMPDMFSHNVETVSRLSALVRPQASYQGSLDVLKQAAHHGLSVKSGLMLGLGESRDEVKETLYDLLIAGCANLTLGQYLAPSKEHIPVARYLSPDEFEEWANVAKILGFREVVAGPLVRSSYKAVLFFKNHP